MHVNKREMKGEEMCYWFSHKGDPGPRARGTRLPCPGEHTALPTPCPAAPPKPLWSRTECQEEVWAVLVSHSIWHHTWVMFHWETCSPVCQPCSSDPTTLGQSSGLGWNLRRKGKADNRFIGVWFTSLNYFPLSSALPPLGNASPSLHAESEINKWILNTSKADTALPCLQGQWMPQKLPSHRCDIPSVCRDISGRSRD